MHIGVQIVTARVDEVPTRDLAWGLRRVRMKAAVLQEAGTRMADGSITLAEIKRRMFGRVFPGGKIEPFVRPGGEQTRKAGT